MAARHFGDVEDSSIEPDVRVGAAVQTPFRVLLPFILNPRGSGRGRDIEDKWFTFNYFNWAGDGWELRLV